MGLLTRDFLCVRRVVYVGGITFGSLEGPGGFFQSKIGVDRSLRTGQNHWYVIRLSVPVISHLREDG
jgi:hypothetical protein